MENSVPPLICPLCGQAHRATTLRPGERARCIRCGTTMERGAHGATRDAPLAWAITGLILAVPAALLPFVTVSRFGNEQISLAGSSVVALWRDGMPGLASWAAFCGLLAPVLLFATLLAAYAGRREPNARWARWAERVQHWAMPEVQVLAVLVAFFKFGSLVEVRVGPGLWCYAAMALALILAWRGFPDVATE